MIHLPAHDDSFAANRIRKVRSPCSRSIGDDGERRLQRMSEVASVTACFLGLLFAVGKKLVDLLGERADFEREVF